MGWILLSHGEGPVIDSCAHDNDPSGSVKGTEFLEYICHYKILKKDSAPWSVCVCVFMCVNF
jgi:hypothetical protein